MSARGHCGECGNDWPECQCQPAVPAQGGYSVPTQSEGYKEWRRNECADFQQSGRQQIVMDAVRQALSEGLYYTNDVRPRVAQILGVTGDELSRGALRVEGGDFGMDVYYARQALEAQQRHTAIAKSAAEMRLKVGDVIGATMFNDFQVEPQDGSDRGRGRQRIPAEGTPRRGDGDVHRQRSIASDRD